MDNPLWLSSFNFNKKLIKTGSNAPIKARLTSTNRPANVNAQINANALDLSTFGTTTPPVAANVEKL
jgi:hypothetical protein